MKTKFDELGRRFVKDFNLPYQYISWEHLQYCMKLFGQASLWDANMKIIKEKYNDNIQDMIEEYYQVRNSMIEDILKHEQFKEFTQSDFSKYQITDKIKASSKNIYHLDNNGKVFVSIDLKKANWQVMKKVMPEVVKNKSTYEDYVSTYTNLDYIKQSKRTRQVVFGKCCVGRQITCERYFLNEIRKAIGDIPHWNFVAFLTDELVYEIEDGHSVTSNHLENLASLVYEKTGFEVRPECFRLDAYNLNNGDNDLFTFYVKTNLNSHITNATFKCVPDVYAKIIHKLYYNMDICDMDKLFWYDNTKAALIGDFKINKIDGKYK